MSTQLRPNGGDANKYEVQAYLSRNCPEYTLLEAALNNGPRVLEGLLEMSMRNEQSCTIPEEDVAEFIRQMDAKSDGHILRPNVGTTFATAEELLTHSRVNHMKDACYEMRDGTTYYNVMALSQLGMSLNGPVGRWWGSVFDILTDADELQTICREIVDKRNADRGEVKQMHMAIQNELGLAPLVLANASKISAKAATGFATNKRAVTETGLWTEEQANKIIKSHTRSWRDAMQGGPINDLQTALEMIKAACDSQPDLRHAANRDELKRKIYDVFRVSGEWHKDGLTKEEAAERFFKHADEMFEK